MSMEMDVENFRRALELVFPQAMRLDDRYFSARIAAGPEASVAQIELVRAALPNVLAHEVGGPAEQFECSYVAEWGYRWLTIRRRLLPGVYKEDRRFYIEELLDRNVFDFLERVVRPRYQGSAYGKMRVRKNCDNKLSLTLVRYCGRWRISIGDIEDHFPEVSAAMIEHDELRLSIPGDTPNAGILEFFQRVAAHLELYMPLYVHLDDPTCKIPADALGRASQAGNYRLYMDL